MKQSQREAYLRSGTIILQKKHLTIDLVFDPLAMQMPRIDGT
jgi:hypothetical protein